MLYSDLVDILLQRALRLGLVDPETGKADGAELELYLFSALLEVAELHDLDAFMVSNPQICTTDSGQSVYSVPADFGRLIAPRVGNKRGIYLDDSAHTRDLEYLDPNAFTRMPPTPVGSPQFFTVARRLLHLSPTPDTNNGRNYTVRGLYIERIERPDPDQEVYLAYPTVLVDVALFRLAGDMGRLTEALAAERTEGLSKLVSGPLGSVTRIAAAAVGAKAREAQTR